jgi:hypothetical protein
MRLGLKPVTGPLGHSLDMVDGGPDGADIAPRPLLGKLEMPDLRGFKPDSALKSCISTRC